jgi:hypothetical protein
MPLYMLPSFIYTYEVTTYYSAIADFAEAAAGLWEWAKAGDSALFRATSGGTLLSLRILWSNIPYLLCPCSPCRSSTP